MPLTPPAGSAVNGQSRARGAGSHCSDPVSVHDWEKCHCPGTSFPPTSLLQIGHKENLLGSFSLVCFEEAAQVNQVRGRRRNDGMC